MKHLFRFAGVLTPLVLLLTVGANAEEPFAPGGVKQACALAKKTHRIVLIDFYTTWCGPCKNLDRFTWSDPKVRRWLVQKAVCRKIDAEKETALAKQYKIDAYPTILLLKPNGKEIDRLVGYRDPQSFLAEAKMALAGKDSVARAQALLTVDAKNDPMKRMSYAQALAQKGRDAAALKEYLWCLDEGNKYGVGFSGVRLSFLLSDIKDLGRRYPAALDALRQRRDAARSALEHGATDYEPAADFASYNQYLGQEDQTLVLYDKLKVQHPEAAQALFMEVSSLLLQKKRYADLISGAGDIPVRIDGEIASNKSLLADTRLPPGVRNIMKQHLMDQCGEYYEALVGTDKLTEADTIRDKMLAFDGNADAYVTLVKHASRAEKPEVVQKLVAQAKSALSAADFEKVAQAAK